MIEMWSDPNFPGEPNVSIDLEPDGSIDLAGFADPGDVFAVDEKSDGSILLTPVLGPKTKEWYV